MSGGTRPRPWSSSTSRRTDQRMPEARIQKVLAEAGVASRRAAEQLVAAARVTVDGRPARIGQRVDPAREAIAVDGRPLAARPGPVYLAVNKPAGVTATVRDRHAAATILSLVSPELQAEAGRLYPVGRLDRESEGLILLTNDGAWAERVLHPRFGVEREYAIALDRPLSGPEAAALSGGIELEEGEARLVAFRPATRPELRSLGEVISPAPAPALVWYRATLHQGWRRQLRRVFAAVGVPVRRLVRVRLGTLRIDGFGPGEVRRLSAHQAAQVAAGGGVARAEAPGTGSLGRPAGLGPGLVVSLDGPASSGKSSVGAAVAAAIGYRFCDTGLLYRALTWLALHRAVDLEDPTALVERIPEVTLAEDGAGRLTRVRVDERDVTALVHRAQVDKHVSQVARHPDVRRALRPVQRGIAAGGRIVMAGRDIGSIVLPDADLKIFLDASVEERARRRAAERSIEPGTAAYRELEADLRQRDAGDHAQLQVPADGLVIRTDGNAFDETVSAVVTAIRAAERRGRSDR
ncbi:MAG: (d)CMP kinase [Chloroflexota bacterium]|nr:MAG: (d)CMP kinase [Chloroflexota bacterium]